MNKKITILALSAMLFALSLPAEAQQTSKVPRIGYLDIVLSPAARSSWRRFGRSLASWDGSRETISPSSTGLERTKALSACLSLRRT